MTRKLKNRVQIKLQGKVVDVRVTATSEEMACKIVELIEAAAIEMVRFDLEDEWKQDE